MAISNSNQLIGKGFIKESAGCAVLNEGTIFFEALPSKKIKFTINNQRFYCDKNGKPIKNFSKTISQKEFSDFIDKLENLLSTKAERKKDFISHNAKISIHLPLKNRVIDKILSDVDTYNFDAISELINKFILTFS